jgi:predicted DNA-binding transcriptional regulator AlpA
MRIGEAMKRARLNSSMLYDLIRAGQFPKWAALPKIASRKDQSEGDAWIAARPSMATAPK